MSDTRQLTNEEGDEIPETHPDWKSPTRSYGAVMDAHATSSDPEFFAASQLGIDLVYFKRPMRRVMRRVSIAKLAAAAHVRAQKVGRPMLEIDWGDRTPSAFRWEAETEVGVAVSWPDGRAWAAREIVLARRTNSCMAFKHATGLNLPVADGRVSSIREAQAREVAIAVIAGTCGLPFRPDLRLIDREYRTVAHVAAEAGLLQFILDRFSPAALTCKDCNGNSPVTLAARHGLIIWTPMWP